ncbi:MAG: twin-arginine translocase subunit TatC [Pseudomonadota bacterium]
MSSATRDDEDKQMEETAAPLMTHLTELRKRLMWCVGAFLIAFILCYTVATPIFNLLVVPYTTAVGWLERDTENLQFIFTAPQEFFFTQIKIGAFGGLIIAFPMIATQLYRFIAPGLYSNERGAFLPFLFATPILFAIGALLVYFLIIPMAMWFFLSMEVPQGEGPVSIQNLPRVSEYLSLIMTLIFAFGLVFQLPVAISLMSKAGLVTAAGLADKRKYMVVGAFVMAAILTPPDPLTQIGLAVPTLLLYEISIYMAKRIEAKERARLDEDGDEESLDHDPDFEEKPE